MAEGANELVKGGVDSGSADALDLGLGVEGNGDALGELLLGLGNELRRDGQPSSRNLGRGRDVPR